MNQQLAISSDARFALAACVLIAFAGTLAYSNTFTSPFVFDDVRQIVENPLVRDVAAAWRGGGARRTAYATFAINYAASGLDVFGFHAANLAIHVVAAMLLLAIVWRTLSSGRPGERYGADARWLALAVALLWALHPLQTQAVTYIVQRMESLMGLLMLGTLWFFTGAARAKRSWLLTGLCVLCCALGMLTKQSMAAAPLLVLWYDRAFVATSWSDLLRKRVLLHAALFACWGLLDFSWLSRYFASDQQAVAGVDVVVPGLSPMTYLFSQAGAIVHYLRLCVWPVGQSLDYRWPPTLSLAEAALPGAFVLLLLGATVWSLFRRSEWSFVGAWFFLILAPTSTIIPIADIVVEHRMYLPLAAVVVIVVLGAYEAAVWVQRRFALERALRPALLGLGAAVALALGLTTWARNTVYASPVALWTDVVEKSPQNLRARTNLMAELLRKSDPTLASYKEVLHQAQQIEAIVADANVVQLTEVENESAQINTGVALMRLGQLDEAEAVFQAALKAHPRCAQAHVNLGQLVRSEDPVAAAEHFEAAIACDPKCAAAYNNLGAMLAQTDPTRARGLFERSLQLDPLCADAFNNLGNFYVRQGQPDRAIPYYDRALAIDPALKSAQQNRDLAWQLVNPRAGL
ncbi:MAG: tetratricopeptide repeat protein [Planctomycetales bacterium]|nr:tetratricopeptide repeat protein [Planctomycetales bacterium]